MICCECGDVVKDYNIVRRLPHAVFQYKIRWCRKCQKRLEIGEWDWGER